MILKRLYLQQIANSLAKQLNTGYARSLSASVKKTDQMILINEFSDSASTTNDISTLKFPGVWLRDNCLCDQCFHKDSLSRKPLRWNNFDCDIKAEKISVNKQTKEVQINWSDKHESTFTLEWLKEHSFRKERHEHYIDTWYRPKPKTWSKDEFNVILKKFQYKDIMENDEALKDWLETLAVQGVSMLKNAPLDISTVKNICNRVGFIRKTTYGEEFSVKSRPGAKNYSYLSEPLPLHTDLPYYEYKPSVTILHTLEQSQSKGGWNSLVDGFHIADQLKETHPEYFKILSETLVNWCDIGQDEDRLFHNILRAPVINVDKDGRYTRINHSVPQRDSQFTIDINKVVPWYRANALFVKMASEQTVNFKTEPGDVITFNNLRMLHGRTGYDDTEKNVRHIVGGFIDWDIIYSKIRVLKKVLKNN
ncbi:gamma-butyrobetaine dioxygenase-like [Cochliomyia hominivorax]